jgi:tetratricopeptide (TPR) repeat protein
MFIRRKGAKLKKLDLRAFLIAVNQGEGNRAGDPGHGFGYRNQGTIRVFYRNHESPRFSLFHAPFLDKKHPASNNEPMPGFSPIIFVILGLVIIALFILIISISLRGKNSGDPQNKKRRNKFKNSEAMIRDATRRLAQNPKDMNALSILADVYFNSGEWEKAQMAYGTLMENSGAHPEVDEFEATMRHGISAANLKRFDDAYHSLGLARTMRPDVFEINYNLGTIEYNRKQYEKAIILLNMANQAQPDHLETRKYLGMSLFRIKKYKEAIDKLKAVIDQQMDDKEAIYYLAYCYFENGQLEMAGNLFSHLRPDPNFGPQASLMAGSIHMKQKQYDEAQTDLEIGLRHKQIKKEVFLELHYRIASVFMKKPDIQEAMRHMRAIHELDPSYKDVDAQIKANAELSRNEYLQTYLIGAPSDFVGLCRRLSTTFFTKARTKVLDIYVGEGDFSDILAEVETPAWEDLILFRFVRSTGAIGELTLRDLYTKSKDLKAGRAFCVTAGTFSETASKFVEARSIDLVDKDGLMKSLTKLQKMG